MGEIIIRELPSFGARYRECRKAAGLTQVEAAAAMGIGRSSISEYETGDAEPTASVIYKMAMAYGVSANYLLGLDDVPDGGIILGSVGEA